MHTATQLFTPSPVGEAERGQGDGGWGFATLQRATVGEMPVR